MPALNRPTPEGRALGAELLRLLESDFAASPIAAERCASCAFRPDTIPNGCVATLMDALKCVMEGWPFYCHMGDKPICVGYVIARNAFARHASDAEMPWEFTGGVDGPAPKGAG